MVIYKHEGVITMKLICQNCGGSIVLGDRSVNDFFKPLFLACDHCCSPLVISGTKVRNEFDPEKALIERKLSDWCRFNA